MKKIHIIIFAIICVLPVSAQNFFQRIGIELWDGISLPVCETKDCSIKPTMSDGLSIEYYYDNPRWSSGIFVQNDNTRRRYSGLDPIHYRTMAFGFTGSYYLLNNHKVTPYFTMKIGAAYNYVKEDSKVRHHNWNPAIIPSCGIEINQWLRFALYYQISSKRYNTAGLTLGLAFGGSRPSKTQTQTKN